MSTKKASAGAVNVTLTTPNTEVEVEGIPDNVGEIFIQARESVDIQVGFGNALSDAVFFTKKFSDPPLNLRNLTGAPRMFIRSASADTHVEILYQK